MDSENKDIDQPNGESDSAEEPATTDVVESDAAPADPLAVDAAVASETESATPSGAIEVDASEVPTEEAEEAGAVEVEAAQSESEAVEPVASKAPAAAATPVMGSEDSDDEVDEEEVDDEDNDSVLPPMDPERAAYPWYVVHTYSGYEQRAKLTLEERVKTAGALQKFGHIIVPQEKVVELVRGEKKTTSKKVFPGYILVQCDLDDEAWHLVKATPKITGFVGDSRNPVPLNQLEVENLLKQMEGGGERARPSVHYEQGDSIKVVDGPFADFNGTVDEVKPDKGKLRVLISIFGRNTPVELDFVQVEKV